MKSLATGITARRLLPHAQCLALEILRTRLTRPDRGTCAKSSKHVSFTRKAGELSEVTTVTGEHRG